MQSKEMFVKCVQTILIFSCLLIGSDSSLTGGKETSYIEIISLLMKVSNKITNRECRDQLFSFGTALTTGEEWALRMVDAMAKPQSGILAGNIMHMGNYDECIEINEQFKERSVHGKYCSVPFAPHPTYGKTLNIDYPGLNFANATDLKTLTVAFRLSYGFCVPKVCPIEDLQNLADFLEDEVHFPLHFSFVDEFCDAGDRKPFTAAAIVTIVIFSIFAAIVVCSTSYEVLVYQKLSETKKKSNFFVAFSLLTNGKTLFSTQTAKDNLGCLNGLRVISLMWVVLSHSFVYRLLSPNINLLQMLPKWKNATRNFFFAAGPLSVDTFFTISGLLVVYLFMKDQAKGKKFSLIMHYIHRLLRLSPSLAMVVLFSTTLLPYMGNGPLSPTVDLVVQKTCEKNWWSTLLYMQNYIHPSDLCLIHTWYLAVDTQMYFVAPLIFLSLVRWPKQTIGAILVIIVLVCSYIFEITWKKHLGTIFLELGGPDQDYIYTPTHVRCTTYLIGMVCGYFVYKTRTTRPVELTKPKVLLLWLFSLSLMTGIVLSHSVMMRETEYNVLNASFFNSLTKVGWSMALSVIILLCVNGYGGPINNFLSSRIFTVLIRLNYSVYLLHLEIMAVILGRLRTPIHISNLFIMHEFWGDYLFTLGAAVIWTLVFELPVLALEKIVFKEKRKTMDGNFQNVQIIQDSISEQTFHKENVVTSN